jgi:hypothetical protein
MPPVRGLGERQSLQVGKPAISAWLTALLHQNPKLNCPINNASENFRLRIPAPI